MKKGSTVPAQGDGKWQQLVDELRLTPGVKRHIGDDLTTSSISRLRNLGAEVEKVQTSRDGYPRYRVTAWVPDPQTGVQAAELAMQNADTKLRDRRQREKELVWQIDHTKQQLRNELALLNKQLRSVRHEIQLIHHEHDSARLSKARHERYEQRLANLDNKE